MTLARTELVQDVLDCRRMYENIVQKYDSLMAVAHGFPHGSLEMTNALHRANALGPLVLEALKDYRGAVAAWIDSYRQHRNF